MSRRLLPTVLLLVVAGCAVTEDDRIIALANDAGAGGDASDDVCQTCDAGAGNPEDLPPPDGGWPWQSPDGGTGDAGPGADAGSGDAGTDQDGGSGVPPQDGGSEPGDAGTSGGSNDAGSMYHAECKGQCGLGCNGLAGRHYCTDACWDHDTCVRNCQARGGFCCHCQCAGGLPAAVASVLDCARGIGDCSCPHPNEALE